MTEYVVEISNQMNEVTVRETLQGQPNVNCHFTFIARIAPKTFGTYYVISKTVLITRKKTSQAANERKVQNGSNEI